MKRPASELLDISRWPSVDVNALEEKARHRYQQCAAAVEHYAAGGPLRDVEAKTEIHRRVLYRMIEHALQVHPDGRPWGFRALVPGSHTKAYERRKASDRWRRWCGLSKVVCMRSVEQSVPGERKMGAPASLDTCENLIEMLLRRRQLSLPDRARNYRHRLLEFGYTATLPAAKAYPEVI